MRSALQTLALLCLFAIPAFGQGALYQDRVQAVDGRAIGGVLVSVCTYSSGQYTNGVYMGPIPCTPTITTYYDPALTQPLTPPILSDSQGNVFVYLAPGSYTVTYSAININPRGFAVVVPCAPGASSSTCASAAAPLTSTQVGFGSGGNILTGSTNLTYNTSLSALLQSASGVFTNTAANLFHEVTLNSCNPATLFSAIQGGNHQTDAFTGCVVVPSGATVYGANAVAGYGTNSSTATNAVGLYTQMTCLVSGSNCWGENPLVSDATAISAASLRGQEIDVNVLGTPTSVVGSLMTGNWSGTFPAGASAYWISRNSGTGLWPFGFNCGIGSVQVCLELSPQGSGPNNPSSTIVFSSINASSLQKNSSFQQIADGELQLNPAVDFNINGPTSLTNNVGGTAITSQDNSALTSLYSGVQATGNNQPSQTIVFDARNSAGTLVPGNIGVLGTGDMQFLDNTGIFDWTQQGVGNLAEFNFAGNTFAETYIFPGGAGSPSSGTVCVSGFTISGCGGAFDNGLGTGYQDATEIAAPANPASGNDRLYLSSSTHLLACVTSGGVNCMPGAGGSVSSVSWGTTPLTMSWITGTVSNPTSTPALQLSPTTGQASHQVIGTCGSGTTFAPCSLGESDLPAATVFADQNATFGAHTYDFSGVTLLKARVGTGLSTSSNGDFGYDTTNKNWHFWDNAIDRIAGIWASAPTNGDCTEAQVSAGTITLIDAGAPCATGSTASWATITNGTNSNSGTFTATGNSWDFTGSTIFKLRVGAALTTTANGDTGYDTTNKMWHGWDNAADAIFGMFPASLVPSNNNCVKWAVSSGVITLTDAGAVCGGTPPAFQTNTVNNSSQTLLNLETSTVNSIGVTVTPSNPSGGIEKLEATGTVNTTGGGTGVSNPIAHQVPVAEGSSPFTFISPGASGLCFMSNGTGSDPSFQSCSTGGVSLQTNGTNNASQSVLNFVNPSNFDGMTFTFLNPTGGNETFSVGGGLTSAGLNITPTTCTNQVLTALSSGAVGTCTSLTAAYFPAIFSTNGINNTTATSQNLITSTVNSTGLTNTPSNPGTNQEKVEITGTVNATSGGTGQDSHTATGVAQVASGTWSFSTALANGTTATTQTTGDNTTKVATDAFVIANALTNPMTTLGDIIYENATPTAARLAGCVLIASVPCVLTSTPTSGPTAASPAWSIPGIVPASITGSTTTYTVASAQNTTVTTHDQAATGTVNVTLPTATTLGISNFVWGYCNNSPQTDTITPTTWTIQVDANAAGSTATVNSGQCIRITVDANSSTQWHGNRSNASGGGGSGTVNTGSQYAMAMYPNSGSNTVVGPSLISTDANGDLIFPAPSGITYGTTTQYNLACASTTGVVADCTGTPPTRIYGVFQSSTGGIQQTGYGKVNLDTSTSVTVNDILCASSTAGKAHDNGSSACTNAYVGVVTTTQATVTVAKVYLTISNPFAASSGTVTSATIAGTSNQITASGTCTITTTGTCTLSLPNAVDLGTDNSAAGTLQTANGSANAHTIWGSAATTSNTIDGFATAPTTGDLVSCTTSSTTCTLTDSGVVAANAVTNSTGNAAASNQVLVSAGTNKTAKAIDFPEMKDVPAANCNSTTAGTAWSIGSGGTVTCRGGTNNLGGYVAITDTSSTFAQFAVQIPEDWDTGTLPYIRFHLAYPGTDGTSSHTIVPQIKVSCEKGDGTTTDDVAFAAAHSSSTITLSSATANLFFSTSNVQMNSTDMTGCIAGSMMVIQVGRATDTATSAANFYSATITFPRLITVQAN